MNLVHTPAQVRRFDAFDAVAGDFLKMFCVAVMSGLFFSLVAGLVVFLIASNAYASPPQVGTSANVAVQTLRGGRLLLVREDGQPHSANLSETDVYARVVQDRAMVRITQTFTNAGATTKGGKLVFEAPADAVVTHLHIQTDFLEHTITPYAASSRMEYAFDGVDAQSALSAVVDYEQRLPLAADQQFRIPFAAGNGALNLMIDLESAADAVTTSDPSAAIERVGATHVVSLINRPLPRDFEMRWTAPSKIARSALVE